MPSTTDLLGRVYVGEYYCSVKGPVIIYCPGVGGLGARQGDIVIVRSHGLLCHFYADDAQL